MSTAEAILNRWAAAVRFCYPGDMTPSAKKFMNSIIEQEREMLKEGD